MNKIFYEAKPYLQKPGDQLNGSNYASTAVFALVSAALKSFDGSGIEPDGRKVRALAHVYADLVMSVQVQLLDDQFEDSFAAGLNTRLRGTLFTAIGQNPVPLGSTDAKVWQEWRQAVARRMTWIAKTAYSLWATGPNPDAYLEFCTDETAA